MLRSIDLEKCIGCGSCFKTCGFDVFRLDTDRPGSPPCRAACPAGIDVRAYAHLLQQGKTAEAAKALLAANPIPALTCRTCPRFCESKCARRDLDEAVNVNALEQYLGDRLLECPPGPMPLTRLPAVAVAGSGAAGLSAAYYLRQEGFAVTVFEKEDAPGGQFRTPALQSVLAAQIRYLEGCGVVFRCGSPVGDGESLSPRALRDRGFKALILACGANKDKAARLDPPFASVAEITPDKLVAADPKTLATRTAWVFAAGSLRGAPALPPYEVNDGREAAESARRYLNGWDLLEERPTKDAPIAPPPLDGLPRAPRQKRATGPDGGKTNLNFETLMLEAARCLTCGAKAAARYKDDCMTCFFCEMACPRGAVLVDPIKENIPRSLDYPYEGVK